jgi:putative PIN family toxin of toxin-antitoxin system
MPSSKPSIVFDSVTFVSAFITPNGLAADLLRQCDEQANLYTAEEILMETREVLLEKPHLRNRFSYSEAQVEQFIQMLREEYTVITPLPPLGGVVRDPEDDMIIACAVAAGADYVVSRDRDLLDLEMYQDIEIVSPDTKSGSTGY